MFFCWSLDFFCCYCSCCASNWAKHKLCKWQHNSSLMETWRCLLTPQELMNIQLNSLHLLVSKHGRIIKTRAAKPVYSKCKRGRSGEAVGKWCKVLKHPHVRYPGPWNEPAQYPAPAFSVAVGALIRTCLSPSTQRAGEEHPRVWHLGVVLFFSTTC